MACPAGFCKAEHGQHLNNNATFFFKSQNLSFQTMVETGVRDKNSTKNFKLPVLICAAMYLQNHFVILF